MAVLLASSATAISHLQDVLAPSFVSDERIGALREIFLTLGGSLLGAAAIVSSLVLFAMQVNVERMPHGLFRTLSMDRRLLSSFAAAFLFAVFVAALSLICDRERVGASIWAAFWAILLILTLFFYGYRRALFLINPFQQLRLIADRADREFRIWSRRAKRATPLFFDQDPTFNNAEPLLFPRRNLARVAYLQRNPHWTLGAKRAVQHAISFSRRYAEQGDHEISGAALSAIVAINASYVRAKGDAFLSTDDFISDTLEHLRQTTRVGLARGDEEQVEQILEAYSALVRVYATIIDYGSLPGPKTHAHTAAFYLSKDVERVLPHGMPDVLMEGARLLGRCAGVLLEAEGPAGILSLSRELGALACCGVANADYRPVTPTCVEQLTSLTFGLLYSRSHEIRYAAKEVRSSMAMLAKMFLSVPEDPLEFTHRTNLGAYYSATELQTFSRRMAELAGAVIGAEANNARAQEIIENVAQWADDLYATEKDVLLEAVRYKSHFASDMIFWICHVSNVLISVSNAPACRGALAKQLQREALWLISVLTVIPADAETMDFMESFDLTERMFAVGQNAYQSDCAEIGERISEMLVRWLFALGLTQSSGTHIQKAIYALAILALRGEEGGAISKLESALRDGISKSGLPDPQARQRAARQIRGRAASLSDRGYLSSSVHLALMRSDPFKMKLLLEKLADVLSPETAGQADQKFIF